MSHLHYTAKSHHLQWNMSQLSPICHYFYQNYCPNYFKHRRNINLSKVSDESVLVLLLLQAELGIKSQRHFYNLLFMIFKWWMNYWRLLALRRTIKRFSELCRLFDIEHTLTRSLSGLQLSLEQIILTYNLRYFEFNEHHGYYDEYVYFVALHFTTGRK